jgi:metal-sulfur cluster biosynthetic enzyme
VSEDTVVTKASLDEVEEALKDVVDPELGINVVDLGLIYGLHVDDENVVTIDMTLTSAACPLTDVIEEQARAALLTGPGGGLAKDIRLNWVWLPPWGPDKISDEGREQLRSLGFNV